MILYVDFCLVMYVVLVGLFILVCLVFLFCV